MLRLQYVDQAERPSELAQAHGQHPVCCGTWDRHATERSLRNPVGDTAQSEPVEPRFAKLGEAQERQGHVQDDLSLAASDAKPRRVV